MPKPMERLGRVKHPDLGECVKVRLWSWEGPAELGEAGQYVSQVLLFPKHQHGRVKHPRHPTGYAVDGNIITGRASVSPSCSYYSELCRYGEFRFSARAKDSPAPGDRV